MCKKCGTPITETSITRSSTCTTCGADLHSCINCKFYSPGSHYDCHETVDELVKDKERANFCDSFNVNRAIGASGTGSAVTSSSGATFGASGASQVDKAAKARAAFDALFS
ncbi:hypothetical protein [Treponema sp.]|uniref:hypothetical protein n=1 Tax=Treponema sp. TaxID=166 RepID=UPI00298E0A87|nr:hypothetical protein [Treponema sp.]MCR5614078.1 hypothetical protein [Treponema sp.]